MIEFMAVLSPTGKNVAGGLVTIATCLGAVLWHVLLFAWDDPHRIRGAWSRDVTRGLFDEHTTNGDQPTRDG